MAGHAEYKEIAVSAPSASLLRQVLGSDASDKEITDAQGRVAILTLNRPKALNALNRSILEEMVQALQVFTRTGVRVVILTGAGRAFSAGVDLTSAAGMFQGADDMEAPLKALEQFPGVTIGAVNGFAFTGGFELALGCDILVASTDAVFADTHCKFGIHPSWGLSQKLPRIIGPSRARLVSFTGRRVDAATAGKWGLVASVVEPAELLTEAVQIATEIAGNHSRLMGKLKAVSRDGLHMTLGDGRKLEVARALEYAESMTMEDFMEMQAFIKSRKSKGNNKRPRSRL